MAGPGGGYRSGKQRSVEASRFAMVPRNDVPRSAFDVSHTHKTTFNAPALTPVLVLEVLPGDSIKCRMTAFARLATPIVPVMDNMILESFFFFVPNRLLWEHWEEFMGATDVGDSTDYLIPYVPVTTAGTAVGEMADYFGITLNGIAARTINVNALPFRAYNKIFNEWFRDQDIIPKLPENEDDGPDALGDYVLWARGKRHDYFTSARPWPAKLTNQDAVSGIAAYPAGYFPGGNMTLWNGTVGAPVSGLGVVAGAASSAGPVNLLYTGNRTVTVDAFHSSAVNPVVMDAALVSGVPNIRVLVNDIRTAVMIQSMLEKSARGGSRYAEQVRSEFGVDSPDARLQRPEYLGGGRSSVTVNPVAQTSATGQTGSTTVLGELGGVATAIAVGHGFSQSFTEHGYILGLVAIRSDLSYQNGINRMWFRRTRFDFYTPSLAHLGEQAIFSKEIYSAGETADDNVFGFQERWSEYKYLPSRISGAFRSTHTAPLDMWHLAQNFSSRPTLNANFVSDLPPMERVLQVATAANEQVLFDSLFNLRMVRAMPVYSLPGVGPRL